MLDWFFLGFLLLIHHFVNNPVSKLSLRDAALASKKFQGIKPVPAQPRCRKDHIAQAHDHLAGVTMGHCSGLLNEHDRQLDADRLDGPTPMNLVLYVFLGLWVNWFGII